VLREAALGGPEWSARWGARPAIVLHSFSGSPAYAAAALELGAAISWSGLVFRSGEEDSAVVARTVPPDRILLETDSPYLAPPGRARRNEPARVAEVAQWLADVRGQELPELTSAVLANFERLIGERLIGQGLRAPSPAGSRTPDDAAGQDDPRSLGGVPDLTGSGSAR
jgi:Tat protein secretion system quality control protein TatD with DNase activity